MHSSVSFGISFCLLIWISFCFRWLAYGIHLHVQGPCCLYVIILYPLLIQLGCSFNTKWWIFRFKTNLWILHILGVLWELLKYMCDKCLLHCNCSGFDSKFSIRCWWLAISENPRILVLSFFQLLVFWNNKSTISRF